MAIIEFSVLSYYTSFLAAECMTIGILFHNKSTDDRQFEITTNWRRVANFDDELDIDFMKAYLDGIKTEVADNIFNNNEKFNLKDFTRFYVNEYKFSPIQVFDTDNPSEFINRTKRMFLKFDYDKQERLNQNEEKAYIRDLLKSYRIDYSCKQVHGKHNDSIQFDYVIDNYGIKIFTFEGKNLQYLISTVKSWSYNALSLKNQVNSVFIYDTEIINSEYFNTILSILKENAYAVLNLQDGLDFLLSLDKNIKIQSYNFK